MKPFMKIRRRYNKQTPIWKQIFCRHDYEWVRKDMFWITNYAQVCKKCGKAKNLAFYDSGDGDI